MKRIQRLTFVTVSLIAFSVTTALAQASDTCIISIVKTHMECIVKAETSNVFVRKPGNGDPKYYVFVTAPVVEFLTKDTVNAFFLMDGHQEGKVTCWSKTEGEVKQDNDIIHQLNKTRKPRRNWLLIEKLSPATEFEVKISDGDSQPIVLNMRMCHGWSDRSLSNLSLSYSIDNKNFDRVFHKKGDDICTDPIELGNGMKLTRLTFERNGLRDMQILGAYFDRESVAQSFSIDGSTVSADDLMKNANLNIELSDNKLTAGEHKLVVNCEVLTREGPKKIGLNIPVVVKDSNQFAWVGIVVGILLVSALLCWIFIKMCLPRLKRKARMKEICTQRNALKTSHSITPGSSEQAMPYTGATDKAKKEQKQESSDCPIMDDYRNKYEELLQKYQVFKAQNEKYEAQVTLMENKVQTLQKSNNSLSEVKKILQSSNVNLTGQLNQNKLKLEAYKQSIEKQRTQIDTLQKEVNDLTEDSKNWQNKYMADHTQLGRLEEEHKAKISEMQKHTNALIFEYQKELDDQKNAFEAQLKALHEKAANNESALKNKYENEKMELQSAFESEKATLKKEHEREIQGLRITISEIGKNANVSRNRLIEQEENRLSDSKQLLDQLFKNVQDSSQRSELVCSTIAKMQSDFEDLYEMFEDYKTDEWSLPETNIEQVKNNLQTMFVRSLRTSGWMNNAAVLHSYSRIPELCRLLKDYGIDAPIIEQLYMRISALLGMVGMAINAPAVLATNFVEAFYNFENADVWIDKFFPHLLRRDYSHKIFDIVRVGYIMGDKEEKPIVQF